MKRLLLFVAVGASTLFAMYGATPPHIAEMQSVPRPDPALDEPKIVQHGKASFYADNFDGRTTASGATMDQNALTAASKDLPLGTHAKVTNLATGESVTVEVNDRGPFVPGRVIDLSKRAADAIDMRHDGVAPVKIEAKPEDQPTPELKKKVAKVAAARARTAKKRAETQAHKAVQAAQREAGKAAAKKNEPSSPQVAESHD